MSNEDGTVWVVFNGEIYNHHHLRKELLSAGHNFRTRADTEVLIHGWEEWGPDLLPRLNGIYAFGLFDRRIDSVTGRSRGLWLVRDPAGVKPLYVGRAKDLWWFSSELAAARSAEVLGGGLRREALAEYLVYRFVPSPGTIYRDVWKIPAGHFCRLTVSPGQTEPHFEPFTAGFSPPPFHRTRAGWRAAIRSGLEAAVRRQLMSDVPVGTLLSGGVDSTVVTRLMRDAQRDAPQAFAVGIGERDNAELVEARRAAWALGVPLEEVQVSEQQFLEVWPESIAAMGEPIANSGVLLVGLLCRRVRRFCKVVLSGQGADEPLGGYPRHYAERLWRIGKCAGPLLGILPDRVAAGDRLRRMARIARTSDLAARFTEVLSVFSPREALVLAGAGRSFEELQSPVRRALAGHDTGDSLNALLYVDSRLSLADDLLIVADLMSMQSSVELRVPFLDLEFQSLIGIMPSRYKVSWLGERKWLYRDAVKPLLPPSLRTGLLGWRARTGRKLGFTMPLTRWLDRWLQVDAEGFLLGSQARTPGFLVGDAVRNIVRTARETGRPMERQLLALLVLETWLRRAT